MPEDTCLDLVITYAVSGTRGTIEDAAGEHAKLLQALADGYRVVDVIATPVTPGGGSSISGYVCVSVVLTKAAQGLVYKFRR